MEEEIKINFLCPFCNVEVKDNDDVVFDEVKKGFAHTECVKKHLNKKEDITNIVDI